MRWFLVTYKLCSPDLNENLYYLIIHSSGKTRASGQQLKKNIQIINAAYLNGNSPRFEGDQTAGRRPLKEEWISGITFIDEKNKN